MEYLLLLFWDNCFRIFVVGYVLCDLCSGISVVEQLLLMSCCVILVVFVGEYALWTSCDGIFVVESLLWNLRY